MSLVQYLEIPIGDLRPNPFNPNKVSVENERKIRESLVRNGFFKPVIVRQVSGVPGYEIIGGQHRWEQARELGYTTVPVANLGEITESRAKEIGLIDNARYGIDDTLMLGDILKELSADQDIQSFLPYGDTDIAAIFSATSISLDDLDVTREEKAEVSAEENIAPAPKPVKTDTIMRFRVKNLDAEAITKLIAQTQKLHGLTTEDELTNAGDALVLLLLGSAGKTAADWDPNAKKKDWDQMLDEIQNEIEKETAHD